MEQLADRLPCGSLVLRKKDLRNLTSPKALSYTEDPDPMVWARFFDIYHRKGWTWYAMAYEEDRRVFWGYVEGFANEWGSWYLDDFLRPLRGMRGIGIERDLSFIPCRLSEAKER